jgi:hypothetical protein
MSDDLVKKLRAVDHLSVEDCFLQSPLYGDAADRIEALEAKLAKTEKALEGCMIGGNHLVTWLPENHLPADTDPLAALVRHGAGVSHDIWCCWRSIMQARAALAELKGDKT